MEPVKVLAKHQSNVTDMKFVTWMNVFVDRNVLLIAFVSLDIRVTTEHGKIYPHLSKLHHTKATGIRLECRKAESVNGPLAQLVRASC